MAGWDITIICYTFCACTLHSLIYPLKLSICFAYIVGDITCNCGFLYIYVYMHLSRVVCMYVCMYVYIYIYVHINCTPLMVDIRVRFTQAQYTGSEATRFVVITLELIGGISSNPFNVTVTPLEQSLVSAEGNSVMCMIIC